MTIWKIPALLTSRLAGPPSANPVHQNIARALKQPLFFIFPDDAYSINLDGNTGDRTSLTDLCPEPIKEEQQQLHPEKVEQY